MPEQKLRWFIFPILLLAAPSLFGEVKVLKNFTLIDGTGRPPIAGAAMIIDNGRISWIGKASDLKVPAQAEVIDVAGKFVMPGLVNLHGHIGNTVDMTQDGKYYSTESIEKNLHTYASYGVTTVQSMGTDQDQIFAVRAAQRAGRPSVARVYTAGLGFVFQGGYGGVAGVNVGYSKVEQIAPAVEKLSLQKIDLVKFWLDDDLGRVPKMPAPMTQSIIEEAHKHGLHTAAHIFYLEDAKRVTNQGITALAHLVRDKPVDQELIDSMKEHHTWQMAATLYREWSVVALGQSTPAFSEPFFTRGVSANTVKLLADPARQNTVATAAHYDELPGFLETAKKNLKKLADSGVKYGMGTDTGPPGRFPGFGEHMELELMVEAGLTPMQVITAATKSGAEFLGAKDLGTLEKSKWADLIVLDADPLANIRNSRQIHAVYIAGDPVN